MRLPVRHTVPIHHTGACRSITRASACASCPLKGGLLHLLEAGDIYRRWLFYIPPVSGSMLLYRQRTGGCMLAAPQERRTVQIGVNAGLLPAFISCVSRSPCAAEGLEAGLLHRAEG